MDRRIFLGAAGGLALAGPAQAQLFGRGASGPSAVAISSREDGLAQAAGLFARVGSGRNSLPSGTRIISPYFTLEIVEEIGKQVRERQYRAGAVATSKFTVDGLDDGAVQSAVDRLYPQILSDLAAAGYPVVTRDEAKTNVEYAKMVAAEKPPMWQANTAGGGKSKFFAPAGFGPYLTPGDERLGAFSAFGMSASQVMGQAMAPKSLNAAVMGIEVSVRFVNIATEGGGQYSNLFGNGIASVRGKAVMALIPERTKIWFFSPLVPSGQIQTIFALNRPVGPANNPITAFDDITSNASRASDIAGSLIGALAGGGPSYQTRAYRISLDREVFPVALEGCLAGVSAAMISQVGVAGPIGRPR
jgi:hypothetical protein